MITLGCLYASSQLVLLKWVLRNRAQHKRAEARRAERAMLAGFARGAK